QCAGGDRRPGRERERARRTRGRRGRHARLLPAGRLILRGGRGARKVAPRPPPLHGATLRGVSIETVEVVVRGYRAFIDGDFDAIAELLDPYVEWYPLGAGPLSFVDHEDALSVVAERYREQYRVELERCVGVGDQVVVGFRASKESRDADDPRPLQSRRKFSVERYSAVVT